MGLFDFFKKKSSNNKPSQPIDENWYLLENLGNRLTALGYKVKQNPEYLALQINSEIEIATFIIDDPNNHPNIIHLMILTIHPEYFANGIQENIVGIGTTIQDKVSSVIDNYITTTFLPIIDSLSDSHDPEMDFSTIIYGKEILWHPKLGNLSLQGEWKEYPKNESFFEIIKDKLKDKLKTSKLNWLKLYISKRTDGTIIGECLFNNEPWNEGLSVITEYAKSWEMESDFQGMKQFILFRRCDAYDV